MEHVQRIDLSWDHEKFQYYSIPMYLHIMVQFNFLYFLEYVKKNIFMVIDCKYYETEKENLKRL